MYQRWIFDAVQDGRDDVLTPDFILALRARTVDYFLLLEDE